MQRVPPSTVRTRLMMVVALMVMVVLRDFAPTEEVVSSHL